jgi:hypothetical protein
MKIPQWLCNERAGMRRLLLVALFFSAASAYAQNFEVTPLFVGSFGGAIKLQQAAQPHVLADLDDSVGFGVSGGFRYNDGDDCEKCSIVGFRWMRQSTHLNVANDFPNAVPFRPSVTLNHFLVDFTKEFPVGATHEVVRPFITLSLGAARMSTPVESVARFEFGIGGGINVFPKPRWGFRLQAEYLPMVMSADVQQVVCASGCIVALGGGIMNQFNLSVGPIFRF